jgi:hypothetical protein
MEEAVKSSTILAKTIFLCLAALLPLCGCGGGAKFENKAPSNVTVIQNKSFIWTGGTVGLVADAVDEDGDPLTFTWKATIGTFSPASATGAVISWIAPSAPGTARITMSVTDDIATVSKVVTVSVCLPFPENISTMTVTNPGFYYILKKDSPLIIPTGTELTIDPGVVVVVDSKVGGFEVDGSLVAVGSSRSHIKFMGNTTVGGKALWGAISASGAGGSIFLRHVEVSNAHYGAQAMNQAVMTLDSCTFFDNSPRGVWVSDRASLVMRGCSIVQNAAGVYVKSASADISLCSMTDNDASGLEMSAGLDSNVMTVDSSVIANNRGNQVFLTDRARPEIHHCSIFNTDPIQGSYAMRLYGYVAIDSIHAERNYWGAGFDEAKIRSAICDKARPVCASAAYVSFIPWLTSAPVLVTER